MDFLTHPERDAETELKNIQKGYKMLKLEETDPTNESAEESDSEHFSSEERSNESFSELHESMSAPDVHRDRSLKPPKGNPLQENSQFYD